MRTATSWKSKTPVFHPVAGGAAARPFTTHHNALDTELFLRIAPELYLKRLTVGGFERVFEIARVFRNEGISTRHNPEFSMLELYQAYADYGDIMELVEQLVEHLAMELHGTAQLEWDGKPLNLAAPWRRASMVDLIEEHTGQRFSLDQPVEELRAAATGFVLTSRTIGVRASCCSRSSKRPVSPSCGIPVFVMDYPKEVSPLSRDHRELDGYVERFEAVVAGRELCNAFSELLDPVEQKLRFEAQEADGAAAMPKPCRSTVITSEHSNTACHQPWPWHRYGPTRHVAHQPNKHPRRRPLPNPAPRSLRVAISHRSARADVRRTWSCLFWLAPSSPPPARPSP